MELITLGDIAVGIAFLVALIGSIATLHKNLKKWMGALMKDELEPIKSKVNEISCELKVVDMEACKNYLVQFLSEADKGSPIDEIEKQRFWEQYDHYIKRGGNSYIRERVEKLKQRNAI